MKEEKIRRYLYNKTPLEVLSFVSNNAGEIFSAKDVSRAVGCSTGATNQALRLLLELDILFREGKGNLYLYKLNADNRILRQFKIFENLLSLQKVVKNIQKYCYEIVLFGSRADGSNTEESDTDLFIRTEFKEKVRGIVSKHETGDKKFQLIIQDTLESVSSEKEDKIFQRQVKKGITLWKGKPAYEEV